MEELKIGQMKLTWLNGGVTHLDGGAMFGVVPKALWSKKYPVNERNQIELRTDPILIQANGKKFLVESGIGRGRLTEKQLKNYGVSEESKLEESLQSLGIAPAEIDFVLLTHMHFDHITGLTRDIDGQLHSVFPNARIITSDVEWDEMRNPNIRSKNTYWKENWKAIEQQVEPFREKIEIIPGITMIHTGGHSSGHCILLLEDQGETAVHMADLMPTHAHDNVLWVLAYDDYPMTSIEQKEKWLSFAAEKEAWMTFYHDAKYRAIKWNASKETVNTVNRVK
ncbi:MBL fold metallo-hydrolase [Bacillus sp. FJAT-42376]|uniref:YtnP family quorum-quenching lactonase n=1 Tax=Bacillus sp. FJAT-42376 TaxID=2014076 RepID=UPI000F5081A4|nr:MBL fold metallo-hydrolase [Bacillus sp. FJAT-42376]AZB43986.1 MBL fold metallo-hydrolase [Bacillus sp. FJAT-42376]